MADARGPRSMRVTISNLSSSGEGQRRTRSVFSKTQSVAIKEEGSTDLLELVENLESNIAKFDEFQDSRVKLIGIEADLYKNCVAARNVSYEVLKKSEEKVAFLQAVKEHDLLDRVQRVAASLGDNREVMQGRMAECRAALEKCMKFITDMKTPPTGSAEERRKSKVGQENGMTLKGTDTWKPASRRTFVEPAESSAWNWNNKTYTPSREQKQFQADGEPEGEQFEVYLQRVECLLNKVVAKVGGASQRKAEVEVVEAFEDTQEYLMAAIRHSGKDKEGLQDLFGKEFNRLVRFNTLVDKAEEKGALHKIRLERCRGTLSLGKQVLRTMGLGRRLQLRLDFWRHKNEEAIKNHTLVEMPTAELTRDEAAITIQAFWRGERDRERVWLMINNLHGGLLGEVSRHLASRKRMSRLSVVTQDLTFF